MAKNDEYVYLTASEARELMGVSEGKMTKMMHDGEIPYVQPLYDRRMKLIRRSDVEAWIARAGPRHKPRKKQHEGRPALAFA